MKKYCLPSLLLLATALSGCISYSSMQTIQGSGTIISETRALPTFDRVSVSGSGELTIEQGDAESLTIQADDNLLPYLKAQVAGTHLAIGPHNVNLRSTQPIRYRLRLRHLNELHLSGSVRAEAETVKTDRLALAISGSGSVAVSHLDARTLTVQISGSGKITAAGQVESQEIHISGSGNHHALDLRSARAQAHISGSGDASVWATDALNAHISGSGRVNYRGRPAIESHISGSGHVHHVAGAE